MGDIAHTHLSLLEPATFHGTWSLPESGDELPGSLSYDPGRGLRLEVIGRLHGRGTSVPVALGVTGDHMITLTDVQHIGSRFGSRSGATTTEYLVGMALIGEHFADERGPRFRSISFSCHNIEACIGMTAIRYQFPLDKPNHLAVEIQPEAPAITAIGGTRVWPELEGIWSLPSQPGDPLTVSEETRVCVELPSSAAPDELLRGPVRVLRSLFEFASMQHLPLRRCVLSGGDTGEDEITVLLHQGLSLPLPRPKHPAELLFSWKGLGNQRDSVLNRWFELINTLKEPCDLLLGVIQQGIDLPLNHQFLALSRALESYHRLKHGATAMSNEDLDACRAEFQAHKDAILARLDPQQRAWLEPRLRVSKDRHLMDRLKQLFARVPAELLASFGEGQRFLVDVRNTRNYLTHLDADSRKHALHGRALHNCVIRLWLWLTVLVLQDLAFTDGDAVAAVRRWIPTLPR